VHEAGVAGPEEVEGAGRPGVGEAEPAGDSEGEGVIVEDLDAGLEVVPGQQRVDLEDLGDGDGIVAVDPQRGSQPLDRGGASAAMWAAATVASTSAPCRRSTLR
jgi:hypothetical protein